MTTTTHASYGTTVQVLTTGLNTLATATNSAVSSAFDNTTAKDLYVDIELNLAVQGSARSAGAFVAVFMTPSVDGTNYPDANETTAELVALFTLDAATTARRLARRDVPIPPGLMKFFARNVTGQAFAASGTTVSVRPHSLATA